MREEKDLCSCATRKAGPFTKVDTSLFVKLREGGVADGVKRERPAERPLCGCGVGEEFEVIVEGKVIDLLEELREFRRELFFDLAYAA